MYLTEQQLQWKRPNWVLLEADWISTIPAELKSVCVEEEIETVWTHLDQTAAARTHVSCVLFQGLRLNSVKYCDTILSQLRRRFLVFCLSLVDRRHKFDLLRDKMSDSTVLNSLRKCSHSLQTSLRSSASEFGRSLFVSLTCWSPSVMTVSVLPRGLSGDSKAGFVDRILNVHKGSFRVQNCFFFFPSSF